MRHIILIFSLLSVLAAFFVSQKFRYPIVDTSNQSNSIPFKIPVIQDTLGIVIEDIGYTELTISSVVAYGLLSFTDTLMLSDTDLDYLYDNQLMNDEAGHNWEDQYGSGLKLFVDPDALIQFDKGEYKLFQPVYIVNETASPIILDAFFESNMLTEAKDENGHWFPIESSSIIGRLSKISI